MESSSVLELTRLAVDEQRLAVSRRVRGRHLHAVLGPTQQIHQDDGVGVLAHCGLQNWAWNWWQHTHVEYSWAHADNVVQSARSPVACISASSQYCDTLKLCITLYLRHEYWCWSQTRIAFERLQFLGCAGFGLSLLTHNKLSEMTGCLCLPLCESGTYCLGKRLCGDINSLFSFRTHRAAPVYRQIYKTVTIMHTFYTLNAFVCM